MAWPVWAFIAAECTHPSVSGLSLGVSRWDSSMLSVQQFIVLLAESSPVVALRTARSSTDVLMDIWGVGSVCLCVKLLRSQRR